MTLPQIRRFCMEQQVRLGIPEWCVHVRWMLKAEATTDFKGCNGFCIWNEQYKAAEVAIARDCENQRHTIIHELLHIRLEGHKPSNGKTDIPLEVAINAVTEALL